MAVGVPGGSLDAGGTGNSLLFIKERAFSVLVFCYEGSQRKTGRLP